MYLLRGTADTSPMTGHNAPLGHGLRIAGGGRLDHTFFADEVRPMLGWVLVKRGLITQEQLDVGLAEVKRTGMRLGEVLLSRGWLFEGDLARALAMQFELEYVDVLTQSVDQYVARMLPLEVARRMFAIPVRWVGNGILVAVADPGDVDVPALEQILKHDVTIAVGERTAIQSAWRHLSS
jgi:Type II secretion system (T2SS), protein E, N-terminal domain